MVEERLLSRVRCTAEETKFIKIRESLWLIYFITFILTSKQMIVLTTMATLLVENHSETPMIAAHFSKYVFVYMFWNIG